MQNEALKLELENLINQTKKSLNEVKRIALSQAWEILQLTIASIIQNIEVNYPELAGKDKKNIAIDFVSMFYDRVFIIVDVPFIPNMVEPIIHKYIKTFLMILVGSTIDAMVLTFRQVGVFRPKNTVKVLQNQPKKKSQRYRRKKS